MPSVPRPIQEAAAAFDGLPGIGPRAALRYAYWLAAQPKDLILKSARAIQGLADGVKKCPTCGAWSDDQGCIYCNDPKREGTSLCVVGTSQDIRVIEESGAFKGRYHVLGGLIDPIEGRLPENLNLQSLFDRLARSDNRYTEVILALDPDMTGDTTALYIMKKLASSSLTVTRLARGLQNGAQIEYADGTTIADALQNRKRV